MKIRKRFRDCEEAAQNAEEPEETRKIAGGRRQRRVERRARDVGWATASGVRTNMRMKTKRRARAMRAAALSKRQHKKRRKLAEETRKIAGGRRQRRAERRARDVGWATASGVRTNTRMRTKRRARAMRATTLSPAPRSASASQTAVSAWWREDGNARGWGRKGGGSTEAERGLHTCRGSTDPLSLRRH